MKFNTEKISIPAVCEDIQEGDLIPHPEWQREYVWPLDQQQDLIDSVMRGMPIGVIIIWDKEDDDDTKVVVDGQQRLTTLKRFKNNEFIDNKKQRFNMYDRQQKRAFTKYQIDITTIRLDENENELDILELFWKLNSGESLTAGELIASHVEQTPKIAFTREIFFPKEAVEADIWKELRQQWYHRVGKPKTTKRKREFQIFTPLVVSALTDSLVPLSSDFKKIKSRLKGGVSEEQKEKIKRVMKGVIEVVQKETVPDGCKSFLKAKQSGMPTLKQISAVWGSFTLKDTEPLLRKINETGGGCVHMWLNFFQKAHITEEIKLKWKNMRNKKRSGAQIKREIEYALDISNN